MRAWDLATTTPWVITEPALRTILRAAGRVTTEADIAAAAELRRTRAVAVRDAEALDGTQTVAVRDGVAIIPIVGPIFRYANLFTRISGGTSIEILAKDFQVALDSPDVYAILPWFDTPGGEAPGVSELSDILFDARGKKPMIAYGGGAVCSGGYLLASQFPELVIDQTALVGSIGVIMTFVDDRGWQKEHGLVNVEIVSSQSPKKRPDVTTSDGRAQIQRIVDDLADVFVDRVARGRGVTAETVLSDFGQGDVFVGQRAIDAGLADRLGSFESVLAELAAERPKSAMQFFASGGRTRADAPASAKAMVVGTPAEGGQTLTSDQEEPMRMKQNPTAADQQAAPPEGTMEAATGQTPETQSTPAAAETSAPAPTITVEYLRQRHPAVVQEIETAAATAERERIKGVESAALPGHEKLIAELKYEPDVTPEAAALRVIAAERSARSRGLADLMADEAELTPPSPEPAPDAGDMSADEKAARFILTAGRGRDVTRHSRNGRQSGQEAHDA